MEIIKQQFVIIKRDDFRVLIDQPTIEPRWCPILKTSNDVNDLIQTTKDEKERNNAINATRFNLPFIIGEHLVIPINTEQFPVALTDEPEILTIFGGQILGHVRE